MTEQLEQEITAWEDWVRTSLTSMLDLFIPQSTNCNYNVKYFPHLVESLESGDTFDETLADGVLLSISFKFDKPVAPIEKIDN